MTVYAIFSPDPVWVLLAIGAAVALTAGTFGRARLGATVARRLVVAGALLLSGLLAYSLLMTWTTAPPAVIA